jgi:hypothetical protein
VRALTLAVVLLLSLHARAEESGTPPLRLGLSIPRFLESPLERDDLAALGVTERPSFELRERARGGWLLGLEPVLERGPYFREDDVSRAPVSLDLQAGLEWAPGFAWKIDCGYGIALRSGGLLASPDYLRHGPWIALRWDF